MTVLSADNCWHKDISKLPVSRDSDRIINHLLARGPEPGEGGVAHLVA
jgi:hypothetical protein